MHPGECLLKMQSSFGLNRDQTYFPEKSQEKGENLKEKEKNCIFDMKNEFIFIL